MVLREVKPLNAKQWLQVTSALKSGPTLEQKKHVMKALERAKILKRI